MWETGGLCESGNQWSEQSGGGSTRWRTQSVKQFLPLRWLVVSTSKLHEVLKLCQVVDRMPASAQYVQCACARTAHKDNGEKRTHSGRVQEEVAPSQTGTLSCFLINSQCEVKILQINELFL